MKYIKTWAERCEEHPDHNGIVTERMIQARMQEEIDDLRAALAEPVQEPVAWRIKNATPPVVFQQYPSAVADLGGEIEPLYAAPPQRKPLSGLEVERLLEQVIGSLHAARRLVRAVERAHGIGGEHD